MIQNISDHIKQYLSLSVDVSDQVNDCNLYSEIFLKNQILIMDEIYFFEINYNFWRGNNV